MVRGLLCGCGGDRGFGASIIPIPYGLEGIGVEHLADMESVLPDNLGCSTNPRKCKIQNVRGWGFGQNNFTLACFLRLSTGWHYQHPPLLEFHERRGCGCGHLATLPPRAPAAVSAPFTDNPRGPYAVGTVRASLGTTSCADKNKRKSTPQNVLSAE